MERTLILLKPDTVQRALAGRILARFEEKGLKLIGMKLRQFPEALIQQHYAVHKERPFYPKLVEYMTSGAVVAMAFEGLDAIAVVRRMVGVTNSREAAPGTIRGDFGMSFSTNLVHGSDSKESAERELGIFFADAEETVEWTPSLEGWIYNVAEELA